MNCDFYALPEDCVRVLNFIFEQPDWVLHELNSENNSPVRTFKSTEAVMATFPLCKRALYFQLYSPEMRGTIIHRKIMYRRAAVPGATFRYDTEGWGLIQLYLGMLCPDGSLTACHTNHNSLKRAQRWEPTIPNLGEVADWDWPAVERMSGRLVRFVRKSACSKQWSRPILPEAHAEQVAGRVKCVL